MRFGKGNMPGMELDTKGLLDLLQQLHPSWAQRSIDGRLKYFMRQGWPSPAVAAGRGAKVRLGVDDVMKFALLMELLDAMVPPGPAAAMIDASWADLRTGLAGAWVERADRQSALPIVLHMRSAEDGVSGTVVVGTNDGVRQWLNGEGAGRWLLLLDSARLIRSLDKALVETMTPVAARRFASSMDEWVLATRTPSVGADRTD
jgi:hypothetical protein